MAWRISWEVVCELCGNFGPTKARSEDASRAAKKRGWLVAWGPVGEAHLCPQCARTGKRPDYWPKDDEPTGAKA